MGTWGATAFDVFWRNALAAVPLALLIAVVCRLFVSRPATRHALWAMLLFFLVLPPLLPGLPLPGASTDVTARGDRPENADAPVSRSSTARAGPQGDATLLAVEETESPNREPVEQIGDGEGDRTRRGSRSAGHSRSHAASPPTAARARPRPPERLAPAAGWAGPRLSACKHRSCARVDSPGSAAVPAAGLSVPPTIAGPAAHNAQDVAVVVMATPKNGGTDALLSPDIRGDPIPQRTRQAGRKASRPDAALQVSEDPRGREPAAREDREETGSLGASVTKGDRMSPLRPWLAGLGAIRKAVSELPPIPLDIWLGGIALVFGVLGVRVAALRRRFRSAVPAPPSVQRMVSETARGIGLGTAPEVLMVDRRMSPMIWCGWRSHLILPADLWSQLDRTGRQAIVCHELAHLRRRDHWLRLGELLVAALYWWHPLLWWVRRRLHEEAEFCCDAWVTWLMPHQRRAYAEALVRTKQYVSEQKCAVPTVGIGVTTGRAGRFARRLTMVMTQRMKPRVSALSMAAVSVMAAVGWLASPAQSSPPKHTSEKAGKGSDVVDVSENGRECKEGDPCKECKSGLPGRLAPVAPLTLTTSGDGTGAFEVLEVSSTFEQYPLDRQGKGLTGLALGLTGVPLGVSEWLVAMPGLGDEASGDDDRSVEERLDRLEKRLDKLMQMLEGGPGLPTLRLPAPLPVPAPRVAPVPRVPDVVTIPPVPPLAGLSTAIKTRGECEKTVRSYKLPEGKLAALTKLMARSDVPILVSPREERIDVTATEAQHGIFDAFIHMIQTSQDEEARSFELPEGKLEALTELMVRPDVPVWVQPGNTGIKVHGTGMQQAVFKAFVEMIHPPAGCGVIDLSEEARRMFERELQAKERGRAAKTFKDEVKRRKTTKHRKESGRVIRERQRAKRESRRSERELQRTQREFRRQRDVVGPPQALLRQAFEVLGEDEAGDLHRRLQTLAENGRVEALLEDAGRLAGGVDPGTLEDSARVLEAQARLLEANAEAIEQQARALQQQADALNEQAETLEEQAEQTEQRAETLEERADELEDEAEDMDLESHSRAMRQEGVALWAEAAALDAQAEDLDRDADTLVDKATSYEDEAATLAAKAEALGKLAEMILEVVQGLEERLRESSDI